MGRTRPAYPVEFRNQMVELVRAGRSAEQLAKETEGLRVTQKLANGLEPLTCCLQSSCSTN